MAKWFMGENLDRALFEVVREMRTELMNALRAVTVKRDDVVGQYVLSLCRGISDTLQGYVVLQEVQNVNGARMLVRPCVEAAFRIAAVKKVPETLYQIARSEWEEDRKLLKAGAEQGNQVDLEAWKKKWDDLKKQFAALFPGKQLHENFVTAYDLAQIGGWSKVYAFQYRFYCNFTHTSLRSTLAWPAYLLKLDHVTVGSCAVVALETVRDLGGPTHGLARQRDTLNKLTAKAGIDIEKGTVPSLGDTRPR